MEKKDSVQKVAERIALAINRQVDKEELRKAKEERFRNALGMRLKTPKKKDEG